MTFVAHDTTYGRHARDRSDAMDELGLAGALAAIETFYRAFNTGDVGLFRSVWIDDPRIRLKNPLGGILDGIEPITELYRRIFDGPATVWVELTDVVVADLDSTVVVSGREIGQFRLGQRSVDLEIRTTRIVSFGGGRWGQLHHHGSIADADRLREYQDAVAG